MVVRLCVGTHVFPRDSRHVGVEPAGVGLVLARQELRQVVRQSAPVQPLGPALAQHVDLVVKDVFEIAAARTSPEQVDQEPSGQRAEEAGSKGHDHGFLTLFPR